MSIRTSSTLACAAVVAAMESTQVRRSRGSSRKGIRMLTGTRSGRAAGCGRCRGPGPPRRAAGVPAAQRLLMWRTEAGPRAPRASRPVAEHLGMWITVSAASVAASAHSCSSAAVPVPDQAGQAVRTAAPMASGRPT